MATNNHPSPVRAQRLASITRHLGGGAAPSLAGYSADMGTDSPLRGAHLCAQQLLACGIDTVFTVLGGPMIEVLSACNDVGIKDFDESPPHRNSISSVISERLFHAGGELPPQDERLLRCDFC